MHFITTIGTVFSSDPVWGRGELASPAHVRSVPLPPSPLLETGQKPQNKGVPLPESSPCCPPDTSLVESQGYRGSHLHAGAAGGLKRTQRLHPNEVLLLSPIDSRAATPRAKGSPGQCLSWAEGPCFIPAEVALAHWNRIFEKLSKAASGGGRGAFTHFSDFPLTAVSHALLRGEPPPPNKPGHSLQGRCLKGAWGLCCI